MPVPFFQHSVAVATQGFANLGRFRVIHARGTTKIPFALVAHSGRQVAGSRLTMLDLAGRRDTKTLLGSLVGLLLRHD